MRHPISRSPRARNFFDDAREAHSLLSGVWPICKGPRVAGVGRHAKIASMLISPSENEDFDNALARAGYQKENFEVIPKVNPFPAQGVGPVTGSVTVKNKLNGLERTYEAGHGTAWVVQFEKDLRTGAFGSSK